MKLSVPLYALCVDEELRPTKSGSQFWQVVLKTPGGTIKGMMWDAPNDAAQLHRFPHKGDIIEISSFKDQMEKFGNIVIQEFFRTSVEALPDEAACIMDVPKAPEEDLKWAMGELLNEHIWNDPSSHKFVVSCLKKIDRAKLKKSPAAIKVHHEYQGGLLVHTAEVLDLCKEMAESMQRRKYNFINTDVLYASAILHDIGKIETYRINELEMVEKLPNEKMISHIFYGMYLAQSVGEELGIDAQFLREVLHCIASHHGLVEWGSFRTIQSIEAGILSRADYISSRCGMMDGVLKEMAKSGQPLKEEFTLYGDSYFASLGIKQFMAGCTNEPGN